MYKDKDFQIQKMDNRIEKLNQNPVENKNLINKAKRILRKLKGN